MCKSIQKSNPVLDLTIYYTDRNFKPCSLYQISEKAVTLLTTYQELKKEIRQAGGFIQQVVMHKNGKRCHYGNIGK